MVYTGKPSRGCQTCKNRRIKCDEQRPTCGNCRKSNRHCPGFPDEFDLVFRNENAAVVRRVRKIRTPTVSSDSSSPSVTPSDASTPSTDLQSKLFIIPRNSEDVTSNAVQVFPPDSSLLQAYMSLQGFVMPPGIQPSMESQATAFFFKNFVLLPQQSEAMRGCLDVIAPFYSASRTNSALQLATHAVALSALGRHPGRDYMTTEASKAYGQALRKVGKALQDPVEMRSDEILLSILLFALYEAVISTDDSISAWAQHVDGAVTLAKMRGPELFENENSRKLFQSVRSMMLMSAIQRCTPIEDFPGNNGWGVKGTENAANRLTAISMGLPSIRSRVRSLMTDGSQTEKIQEAWSLIETVKQVDTDLENWASTLPDTWSYRTVAYTNAVPDDVENADRWLGPVHVYEDVLTASVLNDYRVSRMFCQSVIMACTAVISPELDNFEAMICSTNANFISQTLVDEICASVPYHLDSQLRNQALEAGQDKEVCEALGGYLLVWPLFVACNLDAVPDIQRAWLHGRLMHLGRDFGLKQAEVLLMARRNVLTSKYPSFDSFYPNGGLLAGTFTAAKQIARAQRSTRYPTVAVSTEQIWDSDDDPLMQV